MAEQITKLFSKEIQENLFPVNEFYKQSKLDANVSAQFGVVQVPQAGAAPTVVKNPSSFPLTVSQRTDDVLEYNVDAFATNPIHIEDVNEAMTNYSKRQDIIKDHVKALNTRIADEMAFVWAVTAASNKIFTTGANVAAAAPGATGNRKGLTRADLAKLAVMFDKDDCLADERNILISAAQYEELLNIDSFINFDYVNRKPTVDGQIGEIFGMKVFKRSRNTIFNNSNVKKAVGAATAATDKLSILAWSDSYVRRAEGTVKLFSDIDSPMYLGSIFNGLVRAGGTAGRSDEKGVYSLIQTI
tara:strand:+ start:853 stop:1755 length:903 start_codon:yes stop_codon:yes gene_type:complete